MTNGTEPGSPSDRLKTPTRRIWDWQGTGSSPQRPEPKSSVQTRGTDDTRYYTASWGSPYGVPNDKTSSLSWTYDHQESPLARNSATGNVAGRLNEIPSSSSSATGDLWHLPDLQSNSERRHWLSDDSTEGQDEFGGWLGLDEDSPRSHATLHSRRHPPRQNNQTLTQESWNSAKSKKPADSRRDRLTMLASRYADSPSPLADGPSAPPSAVQAEPSQESPVSPLEEKPPPQAPGFPERKSSLQETNSTPAGQAPARPTHRRTLTMSSKKKIPWKGKNCVIDIPTDVSRGEEGHPPMPLTPRQVEARLKSWGEDGYDIRGFGFWNQRPVEDGREGEGQSRKIYPDISELRNDFEARRFSVSIPNREEWEAYVNSLTEQRLKALGVSMGDEEPEQVPSIGSPAPSAMSSQMQHQPSATGSFSPPPVAPSSAGSNFAAHRASPFSPPLLGLGSTNPSSRVASVVSAGPMAAGVGSPFATDGDRTLSPAIHGQSMPDAVSPGGMWPTQAAFSPFMNQSGSPAYFGNVQNLGAVLSPSHSFGVGGNDEVTDKNAHDDEEEEQLVQEEDEEPIGKNIDMPRHSSEPENSASPPKEAEVGPEHNDDDLEESFERQIEVDPHPDSPFDTGDVYPDEPGMDGGVPQFAAGMNGTAHASAHEETDASNPSQASVLHHPQPHARTHSLSRQALADSIHSLEEESSSAHEKSLGAINEERTQGNGKRSADVEANPSGEGTPQQRLHSQPRFEHSTRSSVSSNPWSNQFGTLPRTRQGSLADRTRGSSVSSKFNADAKEFKFDPQSSFTPGNFSFNSNTFQPSVAAAKPFEPSVEPDQGIRSISNSSKGKLNVAAAAFEPSKFAPSSVPSTDFNFSTGSGSDSLPAAPSFTAGPAPGEKGPSPAPPSLATRLAHRKDRPGSISGFVKPMKQSKAIPIVRPDEKLNEAEEQTNVAQEDENGRPIQGEGKAKRARRFDDDAAGGRDKTSTTAAPLTESSQTQNLIKTPATSQAPSLGKENTPEVKKAPSPKQISSIEGQDWSPYKFDEHEDAKRFNEARPTSPPKSAKPQDEAPQEEPSESEHDMEELSVQQAELIADKDDNLAPSTELARELGPSPARSHKFSPNDFTFNFDPHQTAGEQAKPKTLGDSMFAASPSPELPAKVLPQTSGNAETEHLLEENVEDSKVSEFETEEIDAGSSVLLPKRMTDLPRRTTSRSDIEFDVDKAFSGSDSPGLRGNLKGPVLAPSPIRPSDARLRSDAPSPSPRKPRQLQQAASPRVQGSEEEMEPFESPIRKLNALSEHPVSDWDDVLSPSDEYKFDARSRFFDTHIDDLVGGLLEDRLAPLEGVIKTLEKSLTTIAANAASGGSRKRSRSASFAPVQSDADDEDDESVETAQHRARSPKRDIRMERLKTMIREAVSTQSRDVPETSEFEKLHDTLEAVQASMRDFKQQPTQPDDSLRAMLEEVMSKQTAAQHASTQSDSRADVVDLKSCVSSLETTLRDSLSQTQKAIEARRIAEDKAHEFQRELQILRDQPARQTSPAESTDEQKDEKQKEADNEISQQLIESQMRAAFLEGVRENLERATTELSVKNAELEGSLLEAKMRDNKRREEVDDLEEERRELKRTLDSTKAQMEESIRIREGWRGKFDTLQEDMASAASDIAKEQATWKKRDEEHNVRYEVMRARLEAEARTRERLERELERLEPQEREAMKLRIQVEQSQKANAQLESTFNSLRQESNENQQKAIRFEQERSENQHRANRYEQEFKAAREASRAEIQRTLDTSQKDIEAANEQVNVVRADLEDQVAQSRAERDELRLELAAAKSRSEYLVESANESQARAVREAEDSKTRALDEQRARFEREMDDVKFQGDRQLRNALEDKERNESHMLERLSLSDSKHGHLQERVAHLEERLEIAKSAAQAAAAAAKSAQSGSLPTTATIMAAAPAARGSETLEKVSPQALRESILVLQEQLQEREGRIERLESDLANVDQDAPNKIKASQTEIGWLRELLGVRIGDLEDIITTLSQPAYDRDAARDAAIRLKANIEMEQQEKERAITGGQRFPSLSAISNFASPRAALPLAAAWGNWRKGKEAVQNNLPDLSALNNQTPSKNSQASAQTFLSGLMTPPNTNLRQQTPQTNPNLSMFRKDSASRSRPARPSSASHMSTRQAEKQPAFPPRQRPPTTPPLLRKTSYDQDAESASGFYDDDSTVDGSVINHQADAEAESAIVDDLPSPTALRA